MRFTKLFLHTEKVGSCSEKEVTSLKLMVKAGYIRRLSSGVYQMSSLMCKVLSNAKNIIREEMTKIGSNEVDLSELQPVDIWRKSNRFDLYKDSGAFFTFTDRSGKEFCLGPTAEEAAISFISQSVVSYKQLPISIFQINNKFRDEIRPKNGLLRSKMFLMKDAYTFSDTSGNAKREYEQMKKAYRSIMNRVGIDGVFVKADCGSIGGTYSEEFQAFSKNIGDSILVTEKGVAYNSEVAKSSLSHLFLHSDGIKIRLHVYTDLDEKVLIFAFMSANRFINAFKVAKCLGLEEVFPVKGKCFKSIFYDALLIKRCKRLEIIVDKFLEHEKGLMKKVMFFDQVHGHDIIVDDFKVEIEADLILDFPRENDRKLLRMGVLGNRTGFLGRKTPLYHDIDLSLIGDKSVNGEIFCEKKYAVEIGHIFLLGTAYSKKLETCFVGKDGVSKFFYMGCYGIGISRLVAMFIEQNHDSKGIIWNTALAPYKASIIYNNDDKACKKHAENLYDNLIKMGADVLLDDRSDKGFGHKIKESDLIGIPYKIILGKSFLETKKFEVETRRYCRKFYCTDTKDLFNKIYLDG